MKVGDSKKRGEEFSEIGEFQWISINLWTTVFWTTIYIYTLWLFNIAMGNGPFIDDFPIKTSIYKGFSMAMLNNQMVTIIRIFYAWKNDTLYQ